MENQKSQIVIYKDQNGNVKIDGGYGLVDAKCFGGAFSNETSLYKRISPRISAGGVISII